MIIRDFVKKSIDHQKKLLIILVCVSVISGGLAVITQMFFGQSSVYRETFYIELDPVIRPVVGIHTAGMPIQVYAWDGAHIKVECVAELPLVVTESEEFGREVNIAQDDSFSVSIFTLDMFRYYLRVYLPEGRDYKEINISSNSGNLEVILPEQLLVMSNVNTVRGTKTVKEEE